jgi:hypothetical protein
LSSNWRLMFEGVAYLNHARGSPIGDGRRPIWCRLLPSRIEQEIPFRHTRQQSTSSSSRFNFEYLIIWELFSFQAKDSFLCGLPHQVGDSLVNLIYLFKWLWKFCNFFLLLLLLGNFDA